MDGGGPLPEPAFEPAATAARPGPWRRLTGRLLAWQRRLAADPRFQSAAAKNPLTRPFVRRDAAALYDVVAGFVYSQTLFAMVELGLLAALKDEARRTEALAAHGRLPREAADRLLRAAAALDLVVEEEAGSWRLARRGAATLGAPGLVEMIRHHAVFYRDLADPVAFLRGETEPALTRYWAYVAGGAGVDAETAATYSTLMAKTQAMVAEETLAVANLRGIKTLMDVGGGEGAFLSAALARHPHLSGILVDLPAVADRAGAQFAAAGLGPRTTPKGVNFRDDPLPEGADAVSLIRVLYDHRDETVAALLAKAHAALPPGGRLLVSEPMSGGRRPTRPGDAYFGFYTLAMTTGRPRAPEAHRALLSRAGFTDIRLHPARLPHITRVITARRPG